MYVKKIKYHRVYPFKTNKELTSMYRYKTRHTLANSVGEGTLLWASWFFLNEKEINIFRLMHIDLFLKVTY